MNRFRLIVLTLMLCLVPAVQAASLPFADRLQSTDPGTGTVGAPQPAGLEPQWWRYFEADGEALESRVRETLERLQDQVGELPPDTRKVAAGLLERLGTNLRALPQARARPGPEPPPPLSAAERYTLPQLVDIARRLRTVQGELEAAREEVDRAAAAIDAATRRIDTLMAAYLNLSPTNPERVLRGLEIMADRAAVAVAEERLRVRRAALATQIALAIQLREEQAVAARRLVADSAELERLDSQVAQARAILQRNGEELARAQARALTVQDDDAEGQATTRYHQQQAIRAAVTEAAAEVRLLRFQVQRALVAVLLEASDAEGETLRQRMTGWQARLDTLAGRLEAWTRDSNRERDRAAALVAGAGGDVDVIRSLEMIAVKVLNQDRLDLAQETLIALERLQDALDEARTVLQVVDQHLVSREGAMSRWLARGEQVLDQLWHEVSSRLTTSLFRIGDTPVTAMGLVRVGVILFIAWWISYGLRRALERIARTRGGVNRAAFYTVGRLSHYVILTVGLMVGLSSVGIDFTNFALVAGAIGIGIGFGLQSIVSNFVSGLILLFERTLKVGDFVELASGVAGEVREINVRSTLINTNDNVDIVVPNSEFINAQVINWTLVEDYRRIHIDFKVAYDTDADRVDAAALEAAERVPATMKGRNPGVWLVKLGDSALEYELVVWVSPVAVKRPGATEAAYRRELLAALRRHDIEIPVPQRDLRLRSGFESALPAAREAAS